MRALLALLGSMGLASLIYATFLLITVSQKLGAMTKMRPYYRWLYVAAFCIAIALVIRLLRTSVFWAPQEAPSLLNRDFFYFAFYYLPLSIGLTIALVVTIKYWSWLLRPE